jgi:hypothetical protein
LGRGPLAHFPKAKRKYTALELTFERLSDERLTFLISYVLSRTRGNYTGLFGSEVGQAAPNVTAQFDFVEQTPLGTGLLANDRSHVLKFFGAYRFSFGLTAGATFSWQSGTPINELGGIFAGPPTGPSSNRAVPPGEHPPSGTSISGTPTVCLYVIRPCSRR